MSLAIPLHRIVFAEGMAFPILGHQEPPQVWMPAEANAEQVKDLALKVICSGPYRCHRLYDRTGAIQAHFQTQAFLLRN